MGRNSVFIEFFHNATCHPAKTSRLPKFHLSSACSRPHHIWIAKISLVFSLLITSVLIDKNTLVRKSMTRWDPECPEEPPHRLCQFTFHIKNMRKLSNPEVLAMKWCHHVDTKTFGIHNSTLKVGHGSRKFESHWFKLKIYFSGIFVIDSYDKCSITHWNWG